MYGKYFRSWVLLKELYFLFSRIQNSLAIFIALLRRYEQKLERGREKGERQEKGKDNPLRLCLLGRIKMSMD